MPEVLVLSRIGAVHAWLAERVNSSGPLCFDLQAVTECDCLGLQLLIALQRTCELEGRLLTLQNPSSAVLAACRETGLEPADLLNPPPGAAQLL